MHSSGLPCLNNNLSMEENKEHKVVIGIPTPTTVPYPFVLSLGALVAYSMKQVGSDNLSLAISMQNGVRTDRNRNVILQKFLDSDYEWILWLDTDMAYPMDMLHRYLQQDKKVIGCLYFKRNEPHWPIAYGTNESENDDLFPYSPLNPLTFDPDKLWEVEAIGAGGLFMHRSVFEELDNPWFKYDPYYHIPKDVRKEHGLRGLSHDLEMCERIRDKGIQIFCDPKVRADHIDMVNPINQDNFMECHFGDPGVRTGKVNVDEIDVCCLVPAVERKKAEKTIRLMQKRAGMKGEFFIKVDEEGKGYVNVINEMYDEVKGKYDYYAYLQDDLMPGNGWLRKAVESLEKRGSGLFCWNDGMWDGQIATAGLVSQEFADYLAPFYDGNLLCPEYDHYCSDPEITMAAIEQGSYCYEASAMLAQVDYNKEFDGHTHEEWSKRDHKKFSERLNNDCDGLVTSDRVKSLLAKKKEVIKE